MNPQIAITRQSQRRFFENGSLIFLRNINTNNRIPAIIDYHTVKVRGAVPWLTATFANEKESPHATPIPRIRNQGKRNLRVFQIIYLLFKQRKWWKWIYSDQEQWRTNFFKEDYQAGEVWSDSITRTRIISYFFTSSLNHWYLASNLKELPNYNNGLHGVTMGLYSPYKPSQKMTRSERIEERIRQWRNRRSETVFFKNAFDEATNLQVDLKKLLQQVS